MLVSLGTNILFFCNRLDIRRVGGSPVEDHTRRFVIKHQFQDMSLLFMNTDAHHGLSFFGHVWSHAHLIPEVTTRELNRHIPK
jgi:hypothetical protein